MVQLYISLPIKQKTRKTNLPKRIETADFQNIIILLIRITIVHERDNGVAASSELQASGTVALSHAAISSRLLLSHLMLLRTVSTACSRGVSPAPESGVCLKKSSIWKSTESMLMSMMFVSTFDHNLNLCVNSGLRSNRLDCR